MVRFSQLKLVFFPLLLAVVLWDSVHFFFSLMNVLHTYRQFLADRLQTHCGKQSSQSNRIVREVKNPEHSKNKSECWRWQKKNEHTPILFSSRCVFCPIRSPSRLSDWHKAERSVNNLILYCCPGYNEDIFPLNNQNMIPLFGTGKKNYGVSIRTTRFIVYNASVCFSFG